MGMMTKGIMIALALFVFAIIGPQAIGTIANATTTNWNTGVKTIFQILLPILGVVSFAIVLLHGGDD